MQELTKTTYTQSIQEGLVMVVVGADWCPDCRKIEPILSNMQKEYEGKVRFYHVNFSNEEELKDTLNIRRIPTLIFYQNGKEVGERLVEPNNQMIIEEALKKIL